MRGTMSPARICERASRFGYSGVALTDRNNLYGLWPFLAACRREGLQPIVGAEIDCLKTKASVTCLVQNDAGYAGLCRLLSQHHQRADFDLARALAHQAEGLFVLARETSMLEYLQASGVACFAELGPRPTEAATQLKRWAEERGITTVATHDCGIADGGERELFVLLRAIARNCSVSNIEERYRERVLNAFDSPQECRERLSIWPEAIEQSYALARQCLFTGPNFGLVMPPWDGDDGGDAEEALRHRAYKGACRRYGDDLGEEVVDRLEHELQVIKEMGFSSYFLVVEDIVHRKDANGRRKKRRICGRGSGAASLVAYCLEITNVCPIKFNLYFERFLNPGRSDPPDIDIDFAWDERDEVLGEVLDDYKEHAAMVSSHILFQPRMAVRETAKAHGIPGREISGLTKKIPWSTPGNGDLLEAMRQMPGLRGVNLDAPWPMILRQASRLVGLPRHLSVHPGGVVITPEKLGRYVPVEKAAKGVPLMQWDKDGAEQAGLVKIDLLGNRSLGVIRDCMENVRSNGVSFEEAGWQPEDDEMTRQTVARGETMGCFYIESPAMRLLEQKAGSGDYEQLVIQSSIIRPAANEFVREYVRRLHGGDWPPLHPELADVLDETFGLMVFQEDVSRVAVHLAGFSHARADGLRKVMSKKDRQHRLCDYKEAFFQGCREKNIATEQVEAIWEMMMSFSGYSFCKPHSASYARVSFQAAYLKTHFPAEFMAAVVANGGGYYSTFAYVSEAKRCGVTILPPDVNESGIKWRGANGRMRVGLQAVKGLSEQLMEHFCSIRRRGGRYRSAADFFHRSRSAEDEARCLIHCGALDSLESQSSQGSKGGRAALLWQLAAFQRMQAGKRQSPLFAVNLPKPPRLAAPSPRQMFRREYMTLGFLCTSHPLALLENRGGVISTELKKYIGRRIRFFGWLLSGKLVSTKTGEAMEFLTFEDQHGVVETTFFPGVYRQYAAILDSRKPYWLYGLVNVDFGAVTLTVEQVETVKKNMKPKISL